MKNVESLSVGGHNAVLDAIVDHLHEMACSAGSTMQIPLFRVVRRTRAACRANDVANARSNTLKDRIEMVDGILRSANHQAVAAFETPDTTAGPYINVMNAFTGKLFGATDVIDVVGIAPVDEDVTRPKMRNEFGDGGVDRRGGDHEPNNTRNGKFAQEICHRDRTFCAFFDEFFDWFSRAVKNSAFMPVLHQSPHHVGTHSAKAYHPYVHMFAPVVISHVASASECRWVGFRDRIIPLSKYSRTRPDNNKWRRRSSSERSHLILKFRGDARPAFPVVL